MLEYSFKCGRPYSWPGWHRTHCVLVGGNRCCLPGDGEPPAAPAHTQARREPRPLRRAPRTAQFRQFPHRTCRSYRRARLRALHREVHGGDRTQVLCLSLRPDGAVSNHSFRDKRSFYLLSSSPLLFLVLILRCPVLLRRLGWGKVQSLCGAVLCGVSEADRSGRRVCIRQGLLAGCHIRKWSFLQGVPLVSPCLFAGNSAYVCSQVFHLHFGSSQALCWYGGGVVVRHVLLATFDLQ